ncbi:hypothetical protein [Streptomyces durocortorensis]|uniref:Uncharacterized protein n=1 Tax=Streptomyces durocortorensis TaxID=2811104 RepID=A0ABS2I5U6_9ACTN|nr:hypothetical protein [Streptomyces durocortorensis]MBM7058549.1 hypothetical protein [Streptomyces durocortorensis]
MRWHPDRLALAYTEGHPGLLASLSPDEEPPLTTAALTDSLRRFFDEGILGRHGRGGCISFERLHAAHAWDDGPAFVQGGGQMRFN